MPSDVQHDDLDYAVPRSHESELGEDYDVPRSVLSPTSPGADYDIPGGKVDFDDFYDLPKSEILSGEQICEETYDTPKGEISPQEPIAAPWSSHKPSNAHIPVDRKESGSYGVQKEKTAMKSPDEEPGSVLTQEIYDIPCGPQTDKIPSRQNSTEAGSPVSPKDKQEMSKEAFSALHDIWVKKENQKNGNSNKLDLNHNKDAKEKLERQKSVPGASPGDQKVESNRPALPDGKVENNRESSGSVDSGRSSAEDDDYVDYHEIYGMGRGERPENVYDIPVQVRLNL